MAGAISQFFRLGLIILGVGGCLWWLDGAYFAPNRLPACVAAELPEGHVCLEETLKQWGKKIVWVDARSLSDYEVSHLQLAENRMFAIRPGSEKDAQVDAAADRLIQCAERGECIVVFCSQDCSKAEDIAKDLRELGLIEAPVYVLEGGWDAIQQHKDRDL